MIQSFSAIIVTCGDKDVDVMLNTILKADAGIGFKLSKIFVVQCGDEKINYAGTDRVVLIKEKKREGKASAINKALKSVDGDVVMLASGDVGFRNNSIKKLLEPLKNPGVGMSCSRPLAAGSHKNFVGFLNSFVWDMHDIVSKMNPKGGEVIAFRNIVRKIPSNIAADEAYVESAIVGKGYSVCYAPSSVVISPGPFNLKDFVTQRRRIFSGHLQVRDLKNYAVSTMDYHCLINAIFEYIKHEKYMKPKRILWVVAAIFLELYSRFLGFLDHKTNRVLFVWPIYEKSGV